MPPFHPPHRSLGPTVSAPAGAQHRSGLWLPRLDRRTFLFGSASVALLAACGSDDDPSTPAQQATTTTTIDPDGVNLGQLFDTSPGYTFVDQQQRFTFGLFDFQGAPLAEPPDELLFQLLRPVAAPDGAPAPGPDAGAEKFGEPVVAPKYSEGLPRPYYAFQATPDIDGIWYAQTTVNGQELSAPFEVTPALDTPAVGTVGTDMPDVSTPTLDDDLGVTPICTRDPECPFHSVSFVDARATGKPVVLSISTPAYCQVAICGPVLDLVVDAAADYPGLEFIHAEPWKAPVPGDPFVGGLAPVMEELALTFEPALFFVSADGVITGRLDNVWDNVEMRMALDELSA